MLFIQGSLIFKFAYVILSTITKRQFSSYYSSARL